MRLPTLTPPRATRSIAVLLFILSAADAVGRAQAPNSSPPPNTAVHVRKLTILSSDLPEANRKQIVAVFEGRDFPPLELAERVRNVLRDAGYYKTVVEDPVLTAAGEIDSVWSADVILRVTAGAQYRLADIRFTGVTVFTPAQLRAQFHIEPGDLSNVSVIVRGLERMKNLYVEKGYIYFGAIPTPQMDETNHTIVWTIDVDQGKPCSFGNLVLDGQEPRAGAGKQLLDAWAAEVEGRPYSYTLFKQWLSTHAPWWSDTPGGRLYTKTLLGDDIHRINIRLEFP
jgi:hypothetical protein